MLNNNHQPCDFSEALVSYLYGEIGAVESEKFQAHAAECVTCTAEIAGFGTVRAAVAEWRQEVFAPMAAPAIELPVSANPVILTDEPHSWLDSVREFFTPKVALAAAGFAAIAIIAGLAFAVLNSQGSKNENMVTENSAPDKNRPEVSSSINNVPPANAAAATGTPETAEKTVKQVRQYAGATAATSVKSAKSVKSNVALNTPKQQRDASKSATAQKPKSDLDTVYEEYEDDSLRLADLFAEADAN